MGAAGKNAQRSGSACDAFAVSSEEIAKNAAIPQEAAALCGVVNGINGDCSLIEKALNLIYANGNVAKLAEKYGISLSGDYSIAVGCAVANMNLDRIRLGERKERPNRAANRKHRVVSIVAALLQEYVAYDIIPMQAVENVFGKGSECASLIRELSEITRIPISIRSPNSEDCYAVKDVSFNREQHEFAQELLHATQNPSRAWLIKSAAAWQLMRFAAENGNVNKRRKIARHILGMYLPMVREASLPFQYELQDLLLKALDPESYESIRHQLEVLQVQEKIDPIKENIKTILENEGYVVLVNPLDEVTEVHRKHLKATGKTVVRLTGRVKEKWSIWKKLFDRSIREAVKVGLPVPAERLDSVNVTGLSDVIGFRLSLEDVRGKKGEISPEQSYVLCKDINKILSRNFSTIAGKFKDYIKHPKPNGYKNIHNIHLSVGEGVTFEVQTGTWRMHEDNGDGQARHSAHKDKIAVYDPEAHPSSCRPISGIARFEIISDIITQMGARAKGAPLPGHKERRFIIFSDEDGILRRLMRGAMLKDAAREVYGRFQDKVCGAIINGVEYMEKAFQKKLAEPLRNAMIVQFLEFPEPQPITTHGQRKLQTNVLQF